MLEGGASDVMAPQKMVGVLGAPKGRWAGGAKSKVVPKNLKGCPLSGKKLPTHFWGVVLSRKKYDSKGVGCYPPSPENFRGCRLTGENF